jgi:hypothetical protein
MIEYLSPLLAIPLGLFLANLTKDEKNIYTKKKYFPALLIILAITSATFIITSLIRTPGIYQESKQIYMTTIFLFITILTWYKSK